MYQGLSWTSSSFVSEARHQRTVRMTKKLISLSDFHCHRPQRAGDSRWQVLRSEKVVNSLLTIGCVRFRLDDFQVPFRSATKWQGGARSDVLSVGTTPFLCEWFAFQPFNFAERHELKL